MFAVRVAQASTGIGMPRFSLYSSTSAVMYRASTCKSPTSPAVVRPRLSSSLYTFFVRLWAIKVPAVARRSAARTTPSLQTSPSVVVPVSTSLVIADIRTLPFKRVSKDARRIRAALFKNYPFYLESEIKRDRALSSSSAPGVAWRGRRRSHVEVGPPDPEGDDDDDNDGDSDVHVHFPPA